MTKEQQIIAAIKRQDDRVLWEVYSSQKAYFISFFSTYNLSSEDLLDLYQDSIIAFCENVRKGKLDDLKANIGTYLIGIGKYKLYAFYKKQGKDNSLLAEFTHHLTLDLDEEPEMDDRIRAIQHAFDQLGARCKQILTLFYYENKKLDDIQELLQLGSKDVLKSQKSRCIKQIKELIKQHSLWKKKS